MSNEAVKKVVQRAISDGAFRRQLSTDPGTALRGFDLSAAEAAAIRSGDAGRLSAFGVDLRMSKAFNLSANDGTTSTVSNVVSSDLASRGNSIVSSGVNSEFASGRTSAVTPADGSTGSSALASGDGAGGNAALIGGAGATGNAALVGGSDGSMIDSALVSGNTSDTDPMIASGNEAGRAGSVIPGDSGHAFGAQTGSDGGTAVPDETDQYSPSFHSSADNVIVSDDGASGASTPGEAGDGPNIQP